MDRSIKIFRQLRWVFEPYRMIFKEPKGEGGEAATTTMFPQKNIITTKVKFIFVWSVNFSRMFAFGGRS